MTQRQLNMINAIDMGIRQARRDLAGPGAESAMKLALEEFLDDSPRPMSLATTAYITAMLIAYRDRGEPDILD